MASRSTSALRIFLIFAAVLSLLVVATGVALADDPPPTDTTTADTPSDTVPDTTPETTPDTTEDTTPDTTPETTPATTEDTTPDTQPNSRLGGPSTEGEDLALTAAATPGHLEVTKVADSGDPEQTFTFTLYSCPSSVSGLGSCTTTETQDITVGGGTGSASAAFSTDLANQSVGFLGLGPRYRIIETVPSGWQYQGSSCSGNGTDSSLLFEAGQQFRQTAGTAWNCTFNNANYDVTISKTVDGTDGSFDISLQRCSVWVAVCISGWDTVDTSAYSNGTTNNFPNLDPGVLNTTAFRVVEDVEDGYRLTGVSCTGGGTIPNLGGDDLSVDGLVFFFSGDSPSRSCEFVNTENRITITKATSPVGAPRDFTVNLEKCDFSIFANCLDGDWDPIGGSPYTLSDGDSVSLTGTDVDATLFDRFFRVLEDDPGDWDVAVECSGQFGVGSPVSITRGEAFTFSLLKNIPAVADCTISNTTETGSITVAKVSEPAGGEGFDFSFVDQDDPSGPTPSEFSLDDDQSTTFADLFPSGENGYAIDETSLPDGWSLDGVSCPDADIDTTAGGVVVFLARGQNVTCTFTNTNPLEPAISMTKTPDPTSAVVGDMITYIYVVTNEGPVDVTGLTVVDTPLGDVTLDTTTLAPTGEPGDTATGTLTRDVTDADAGTTITNTALASGFVSCNPEVEVCAAERGVTEVTAEAEAAVGVAAVGGEVVTNDPIPGVSSATTDGQLPFTGSSTLGPILGALGLLVLGGMLVLFDRRRQQGLGA